MLSCFASGFACGVTRAGYVLPKIVYEVIGAGLCCFRTLARWILCCSVLSVGQFEPVHAACELLVS
jgi:hypothetical protein